MPALTRVLGAATAAYSATIIAAPKVLAKPCGLVSPGGEVAKEVRTLIGGIGARDAAIGLAMVFAPPGRPLQTALAARVASDAADALVFGTGLPERSARKKVAVFAAAWAALCAASALLP
ncbi:hypothetical protein [Amycolatopsis rifamycinica]|uniref:DUF4267 domain-containing protein n=1 Tax=Amycolatopsis rifamycinica TaxID=287986 RepID=A0A066UEH1_9PSEU|nr:hypothetical protein [Amycolatopsis rifamycinica]KDN22603.1 hypothetical protein DV20_08705 [Amycolatopsis rifamycinica]